MASKSEKFTTAIYKNSPLHKVLLEFQEEIPGFSFDADVITYEDLHPQLNREIKSTSSDVGQNAVGKFSVKSFWKHSFTSTDLKFIADLIHLSKQSGLLEDADMACLNVVLDDFGCEMKQEKFFHIFKKNSFLFISVLLAILLLLDMNSLSFVIITVIFTILSAATLAIQVIEWRRMQYWNKCINTANLFISANKSLDMKLKNSVKAIREWEIVNLRFNKKFSPNMLDCDMGFTCYNPLRKCILETCTLLTEIFSNILKKSLLEENEQVEFSEVFKLALQSFTSNTKQNEDMTSMGSIENCDIPLQCLKEYCATMKLIRSRILRVAILQCCTHSWKYLQAFVGAAEMSSKLSKRLHGCVDAVTALNDHFASFCKQPLSVKSESTNLDGLLFKNSLRTLCTHAFCLAERCAAFVEKFTNDESSVQLELMKEKFDEFSEIVHDALQCIARCLDNAADVFQECRLSSNEFPLLDPFVSLESENSSTENMKLILPEFENPIVDQVFQADTGDENCNLSSECTTAEQQKFDDDQDRAKLQRHLLGELKVVLQGVEKRWRVREQRALGSNSAAAARDCGSSSSSSSNLGNDVENEKKLINETTNSDNLWTTPARSEFAAQLDKLLSHHISETKQ
ncbi:hypothetical protein T03_12780 [Trichinella britovi]|uniref:Vezatin n=1 Tax=Trichinella britovi TaxID=45882 RepID=A0A0V1CXL0_TRIBR|nr:hypothetical protein T03_12780 [Trichinella britovi]